MITFRLVLCSKYIKNVSFLLSEPSIAHIIHEVYKNNPEYVEESAANSQKNPHCFQIIASEMSEILTLLGSNYQPKD